MTRLIWVYPTGQFHETGSKRLKKSVREFWDAMQGDYSQMRQGGLL